MARRLIPLAALVLALVGLVLLAPWRSEDASADPAVDLSAEAGSLGGGEATDLPGDGAAGAGLDPVAGSPGRSPVGELTIPGCGSSAAARGVRGGRCVVTGSSARSMRMRNHERRGTPSVVKTSRRSATATTMPGMFQLLPHTKRHSGGLP